jgi:hypothetical protein
MEIYREDLTICLKGNDYIKEAFIESAEKGLVFPFIPFADMKISDAFKIGWIKEKVFGFYSYHFISGFEIKTGKFGKIRYGGKIYKTNTGFNIINVFFGNTKKNENTKNEKLIDEEIQDFSVEEVYIKLLPYSSLLIRKKRMKDINLNDIKSLEVITRKQDEENDLFFFFYDSSPEIEDYADVERFELPKDYQKILDILPRKKIRHFYEAENIQEILFIIQTEKEKNLIISKKNKNFLILKTI